MSCERVVYARGEAVRSMGVYNNGVSPLFLEGWWMTGVALSSYKHRLHVSQLATLVFERLLLRRAQPFNHGTADSNQRLTGFT